MAQLWTDDDFLAKALSSVGDPLTGASRARAALQAQQLIGSEYELKRKMQQDAANAALAQAVRDYLSGGSPPPAGTPAPAATGAPADTIPGSIAAPAPMPGAAPAGGPAATVAPTAFAAPLQIPGVPSPQPQPAAAPGPTGMPRSALANPLVNRLIDTLRFDPSKMQDVLTFGQIMQNPDLLKDPRTVQLLRGQKGDIANMGLSPQEQLVYLSNIEARLQANPSLKLSGEEAALVNAFHNQLFPVTRGQGGYYEATPSPFKNIQGRLAQLPTLPGAGAAQAPSAGLPAAAPAQPGVPPVTTPGAQPQRPVQPGTPTEPGSVNLKMFDDAIKSQAFQDYRKDRDAYLTIANNIGQKNRQADMAVATALLNQYNARITPQGAIVTAGGQSLPQQVEEAIAKLFGDETSMFSDKQRASIATLSSSLYKTRLQATREYFDQLTPLHQSVGADPRYSIPKLADPTEMPTFENLSAKAKTKGGRVTPAAPTTPLTDPTRKTLDELGIPF